MKNLLPLSLIATSFVLLMVDCKKNSAAPQANNVITPPKPDSIGMVPDTILAARWSIVSDTVANKDSFYVSDGGDAYYPPSGNYVGDPNDYLSFTTAGVVNGSEDGLSVSGTYTLLPDSGISLSMRPALNKAKVKLIAAGQITISGTNTNNNGGSLSETIYLKK